MNVLHYRVGVTPSKVDLVKITTSMFAKQSVTQVLIISFVHFHIQTYVLILEYYGCVRSWHYDNYRRQDSTLQQFQTPGISIDYNDCSLLCLAEKNCMYWLYNIQNQKCFYLPPGGLDMNGNRGNPGVMYRGDRYCHKAVCSKPPELENTFTNWNGSIQATGDEIRYNFCTDK